MSDEDLKAQPVHVRVAGRIMSIRKFGKASFFHLQDAASRLQVYARSDRLGAEGYTRFSSLDIGDIVGFPDGCFGRIRKNSRSKREEIRLLTKCLRPLPEKWHGLADVEARYRQRYVDLMVNPEVRQAFQRRSQIVRLIRRFFEARDFLEVETPMMQPIPGGAAARPFITHHNALDLELYLRVAPELYLKRLLVGGFDRVFELNRNFRNEGISVRHNPEFTMLEFYQAYATFADLMTLTEELFAAIATEVAGGTVLSYGGESVDLTPPWRRLTIADAIVEYGGVDGGDISSIAGLHEFVRGKNLQLDLNAPYGNLLVEVFEHVAEAHLIQPTFITGFPIEVSPWQERIRKTRLSWTASSSILRAGRWRTRFPN